MSVLELFAPGSRRAWLGLVVGAGVAGLTSVAALAFVGLATETPKAASALDLLLFIALVLLATLSARAVAKRLIATVEASLSGLRLRIVDEILATDLRRFEQIGGVEIFDRLGQNLVVFTLTAAEIGGVLQSVCVFACAIAYLAWLSPTIFVLLLPLQIVAVLVYRSRQRVVETLLETIEQVRLRYLDGLLGLLHGAKELKLNRARARGVQAEFERDSAELRDLNARVNSIWDDNTLFMTLDLYLLLAALVFVLPAYVELAPLLVGKLVVVLMFAWGAVGSGLHGYTAVVEARSAYARIAELEAKLVAASEPDEHDSLAPADPFPDELGRIEARGLEYEYPASTDERPFHVGPIDLVIEPGEILFIVGGNGSGKSTLLKLLTGLYEPQRGTLRLAGVAVRPSNGDAYRERISVIFSDFHLFTRAYGLLEVDPARVRELLAELQLDHKTSFARDRFDRRRLSTGQRKRLAMVIALLEQRPIIVLDEWAADQDPEFRRYFYEQLLPALRQQGKTVIAVSHDDRYFHCADRVVVLSDGMLDDETSKR